MNILFRATMAMAALAVATTLNAGQITLPTTLDTLLPDGDFAMVGDLKFDTFAYSGTGEMPAPADVNVLEIVDGDGYPGLRFQGGFADAAGGSASDGLIGFTVTTNGRLISDAHLAANPDLLGGTPGTGVASITETFLPEITMDSISVFDNGTVEQLSDWIIFDSPVAVLNVQKDILLRSADDGAGATLSFVDQTFSMVPEPAAGMMLFFGFTCVGLLRRQR